MCFSVKVRVRPRILLLSKAQGCHGSVGGKTGIEEGRKYNEYMKSGVDTLWFFRSVQTHQLLSGFSQFIIAFFFTKI